MPKFHISSIQGDSPFRVTINPFNDRESAENHLQQYVAQYTDLKARIEEITDHEHLVDLLLRVAGCNLRREGKPVIKELARRLTTHSLEEAYNKLTAEP